MISGLYKQMQNNEDKSSNDRHSILLKHAEEKSNFFTRTWNFSWHMSNEDAQEKYVLCKRQHLPWKEKGTQKMGVQNCAWHLKLAKGTGQSGLR